MAKLNDSQHSSTFESLSVSVIDYFFHNNDANYDAKDVKFNQLMSQFSFEKHREQALALVEFINRKLELNPDNELTISYVDHAKMNYYHRRWMDLPGTTDVLSLPMDEIKPGSQKQPAAVLGDILISPQVALEQAEQQGHSLSEEMLLLQTHGILHLLGYDHQESKDKQEMFDLQESILSRFLGITAPRPTEDNMIIDKINAQEGLA